MCDYTIYYKTYYDRGNLENAPLYDVFYSAFDNSERTKNTFNSIQAKDKKWFIFPQYQYEPNDLPPAKDIYTNKSHSEVDYFAGFRSGFSYSAKNTICIDITGFIRPHLMYLLQFFWRHNIRKIDLLYSEPISYKEAENTKFSGYIEKCECVEGFTSNYDSNVEDDLLIICAGYDDKLVAKVVQEKQHCKNKYYIFGFPSLQPDMYQENRFNMYKRRQVTGEIKKIKFAPAYDPFVTAQAIEEIIEECPNAKNIYLSPLSTKPQTIGMALYYIMNFKKHNMHMIFPYSNTYAPEHTIGIKRTWKYTIELPEWKDN
jgi:hypothetical protein